MRILLVDSHPVVAAGVIATLRPVFGNAEITTLANFSDAIDYISAQPVDLIISDFHIEGGTVLSLLDSIGKGSNSTRCLIFSAFGEIRAGYPCMRAGAAGFVSKTASVGQLVEAVSTVLAGRLYVGGNLARALMGKNESTGKCAIGATLSKRELEVFSMIGTSIGVSQIAVRLGVSVKTVEAHRENIKNKLGFTSAAEVTAAAVRWLDETSVSI